MAFAIIEYFLELYFVPGLKAMRSGTLVVLTALLGLVMVLIGEAVRKTAMVTAGCNFTHLIKEKKRPEHKIVTTGLYA